ncbi:MAG: ferredoxin family protein [Verrucomicrobia bacterium]|nr:ferredoxin family protein [Verrucomicrobiota bacterium]
MSLLTVLLFQSPDRAPRRLALEESILAVLAQEPDIAVAAMPPLYDLTDSNADLASLRALTDPLAALAWLYPRAIHWTLHQRGIKGRVGKTQLDRGGESASPKDQTPKDAADAPARMIWSLDLRDGDTAAMHVAEIQRILQEVRTTEPRSLASPPIQNPKSRIQNPPPSRWYPVIDFARCNHCMECIDFCLFGVYGVDDDAHLVVESPDNCKPGCPACSRVCPENAIFFPMHRAPSIAGAPGAGPDARKLDLSELFGAPAAVQLADDERNAALAGAGKETKPKDDLDKLMDALDDAKL